MAQSEADMIFDPATRFNVASEYRRYLIVEIALAQVQAELGLISQDAAQAIAEYARPENLDMARLQKDRQTVGFPIVGLVRQIAEIVPNDHGQYAHWGATTQDIMDTGLILALRDVIALIDKQLGESIASLAQLAAAHTETLMSGRSQLQHAVPVTFGYKAAGWAQAMARHRRRLRDLSPRLLQVQFGGAVGTMVAVHPHGARIRAGLADRLGLGDPGHAWHSHRDGLVEFINFLGLLTGSLAKIATDIIYMAQTEVAEVSEPVIGGRGISSTMPHKRNPILSQNILGAARKLRGAVSMMLDAMIQDHERGTGSWQSEWSLIPEACTQTLLALEDFLELAKGLEVNEARMLDNIGLSGGFAYAEALMMALAPKIGRQNAHDLLEAVVDKTTSGLSFHAVLLAEPEITAILPETQLQQIFSGDLHREAGAAATAEALKLLEP